jgi:MFS family permease
MTRTHKLVLLGSLYFAQGLPYGFFTQALPVLMREAGMSLKAISATSILFIPWALKFLWAPLVDHVGTRKQWIVPLQFCATLGAAALAFADPGKSFTLIFAAMLLFNLLAAMQDVATDGLAVCLLSPAERGLGNGLQVGAYRIGMIAGGGALLLVFAQAGWMAMYGIMALALALTCIPVLASTFPPQRREAQSWRALLLGWTRRLAIPGMRSFLLLICFYKFGDSMASSLVGPFMSDAGLSKQDIAIIKGTLGSAMGLAGAAAGGWLAFRLGRRRALIACGVLQTLSLLLYVACAVQPGVRELIYAACTAEHLLGGMATVALFTLMMDASEPEHAGTDYTLLACAVVVASGLASFIGATIADATGYAPAFAASVALSALGCVALVRALDRRRGPTRLHSVWPVAELAAA